MVAPQQPPVTPRKIYGRRKGPALSARKQRLFDTVLPQVSLDLPPAGTTLDPAGLFARPVRAVWLEIGFGKGEHLAWQARQHPDVGFIGCEPYINGMAGLLAAIDGDGGDDTLTNIRVYGDDARDVLAALPDASLDRVFLLHPDPWPKSRHAKRRFVNPDTLDALARVMADGAELRIGTDHPVYRRWTAMQMARRTDFRWLADRAADWRTRAPDWPQTRYEAKARGEGRDSTYFRYCRCPRGAG